MKINNFLDNYSHDDKITYEMLLDWLKILGTTCPVCDSEIFSTFMVSTDESACSYTLTNIAYPLLFSKRMDLGDHSESICIDEKDCATLPAGVNKIHIYAACEEHYVSNFYNMFVVGPFEKRYDGPRTVYFGDIKPIEEIKVKNLLIKNFYDHYKTIIYRKKDKISSSGWAFDNYRELLSMPLRPIRSWPIKDLNELDKKINNLLLLI